MVFQDWQCWTFGVLFSTTHFILHLANFCRFTAESFPSLWLPLFCWPPRPLLVCFNLFTFIIERCQPTALCGFPLAHAACLIGSKSPDRWCPPCHGALSIVSIFSRGIWLLVCCLLIDIHTRRADQDVNATGNTAKNACYSGL